VDNRYDVALKTALGGRDGIGEVDVNDGSMLRQLCNDNGT